MRYRFRDGGETTTTPGIELEITPLTSSPQTLKEMETGETIKQVTVKLLEPFDGDFDLSVGFPSNYEELIKRGEADLKNLNEGAFHFEEYYRLLSPKTLNLYVYGSATQGKAIIFVEL